MLHGCNKFYHKNQLLILYVFVVVSTCLCTWIYVNVLDDLWQGGGSKVEMLLQ